MGHDVCRVRVPAQLAGELALEGFDFAGTRGALDEMLAVSSVGANLVTILVARDKAAALVAGVRTWLTRRTAAPEGSELVLDLSLRNGDRQYELRVVARRGDAGAPPRIDTAALESLLASMTEDTVPGE